MSSLLIRHARVIDPAQGLDSQRDVLVADGLVAAIGREIDAGDAKTVVDADGLWLWPGLVDAHVHFREPGFTEKETIRTGSLAAAAGGYTSVICEPNTDPPIDTPEAARDLMARARRDAAVRLYCKAAMTVGRMGLEPADAAALAAVAGVVALSDDGDPVVDPDVMAQACRAAAGANIVVSPHCEDSPRAITLMESGVDPGFEPVGPFANEARYVSRDLELARRAGCRIHVSHVSLAESVEAVLRHKSRQVSFEVAPHHLLLSADDYLADAVPRVCPPLRSGADRAALCEALASGQADAVASDHAPHTAADKAAGASGLIGLETTLGLMLAHFVHEDRLSPSDAVRVMALNPARIFRLPAGTLAPGLPADMVLIDPHMEWTVDPEDFRSKSRNCPYAGRRLRGRAVATYVAGKQVFALPSISERI